MGRTVAPVSQVLEGRVRSWSEFRRALRRGRPQEALTDRLSAAELTTWPPWSTPRA